MTANSRKLRAMLVIVFVLIFSSTVNTSRGEGMIYIYYVETDRQSYEIGENVNVTAAWHIYYGNSLEYSEAVISCRRGQSSLSSMTWLNETEGYHVHQTRFLLNPSDWNPSDMGENGTAQARLSLQPEGGYLIQRRDFEVTRAGQNCTLVKVTPAEPSANASVISVMLRVFNRNNSSFGVGSNKIFFNVTNPQGLSVATNSCLTSDADGFFEVSFSPGFVYGPYLLSVRSAENERYCERRFSFTVNVGGSPTPTNLSIECFYLGGKYNSTASYALEPARITAKLMSAIDGTGIKDQLLNLRILDYPSLSAILQMDDTTNTSGFVTCTFNIPYEGRFTVEASYDGLSSVWRSSYGILNTPIMAGARNLSIIDLSAFPSTVAISRTYTARYLVVDTLSGDPVGGSHVAVRINDLLLAEGATNEDGAVELSVCFPDDDNSFAGNATMLVEASYLLARGIYSNASLSASILCKILTIIRLKTSSQNVLEDGETLLIQAELLSSNLTPLSNQSVRFIILTSGGDDSLGVVIGTTDSRGTSVIPLRLKTGVVTIMVVFDGNAMLNPVNITCSFRVLPMFRERIASSLTTIVASCLLSVVSLLVVERSRRRVKWQDMPAG